VKSRFSPKKLHNIDYSSFWQWQKFNDCLQSDALQGTNGLAKHLFAGHTLNLYVYTPFSMVQMKTSRWIGALVSAFDPKLKGLSSLYGSLGQAKQSHFLAFSFRYATQKRYHNYKLSMSYFTIVMLIYKCK